MTDIELKIRIFLFDLDGTLINSGWSGVRALQRAFWEVFEIEDGMHKIRCDGKTDRAIVREVLSGRQLDSEANIDRLLESYISHLPAAVTAADGYRVIPGVFDTLEYLGSLPGMLCGLATGNVIAGAKTKLARADLFKYFPVGGFGSDAEDRAELVKKAVERAREYLSDARARAVIIGDTPLDILAAHSAGHKAIGVATGNFDTQALEEAGGDMVLVTLANPKKWITVMQERFSKTLVGGFVLPGLEKPD
ncbi:MAG: HAD hydrolase-like protein [Deltaproteobacteria bacterium]|nr:HAD hydrolase-like protein [Deltaproteobacteria bacterium]